MTAAPALSVCLASASPRRRELLQAAGVQLTIVPADLDETPGPDERPVDLVLRLARAKAAVVPDDAVIVVAADTAVVLDDVAYAKPDDDDHARRMLRALSGRTHQVLTGWCVRRGDVVSDGVVATEVTFRVLDDGDIDRWLATGAWRDKAGAYAIQGAAAALVARVDGSLTNVIGLPLDEVLAAIRALTVTP
jgi:septum formation protein